MSPQEKQDVINRLNKYRADKSPLLVKKVREILAPLSYDDAGEVLKECREKHKNLVPMVEAELRYKF